MNFAFTTFFGRQIASKIDKTTRVRKSCKKVCNAFLFPSKQIIYPWKSEFLLILPRKNPNIWMFEAWIIKIAPLVANEKPQNMWERDNSVLSSDLCNYIPAVPSWWEICRFWSCLGVVFRNLLKGWRLLTRQYFFSLWSDNSTPKAMKWMAIWSNWIVQNNALNWSFRFLARKLK